MAYRPSPTPRIKPLPDLSTKCHSRLRVCKVLLHLHPRQRRSLPSSNPTKARLLMASPDSLLRALLHPVQASAVSVDLPPGALRLLKLTLLCRMPGPEHRLR